MAEEEINYLTALAARRLVAHRAPVVDGRIGEASQAMRAAFLRRDGREVDRQWEILCALRGGPPKRMAVKEREALLEKVAMLAAEAKARAAARQ